LEDYAKRSSSAMAIVAVAAARLDMRNAPSLSIIVHHRIPGLSTLDLMISLWSGLSCQGGTDENGPCGDGPLLLVLWREQHPQGQEQIMLGFDVREPAAEAIRLSKEKTEWDEAS
jgi:hypothetical protein